jgi:hypothetical protein
VPAGNAKRPGWRATFCGNAHGVDGDQQSEVA